MVLLAILFSLSWGSVHAQCTFLNDYYTNLTPTGVGDTQTANCAYGGEYIQVDVLDGAEYTFTTCGDTDFDTQLTLFNSTATGTSLAYNEDDCGMQSTITWVATFTGSVYLQVNEYNCTTNTTCMTVNVTQNTAGSAPANDDPCSAITLTPGTSCSFSTFTTTGATDTGGVTAPGCGSYSGGDVWFEVTVPASGHLIIDSDNIDFGDGAMAIYSGTCGSLTLIECDDDDSANGDMPLIDNNTLTPSSTIFIRFWEYGNNDDGQFDICVEDGNPSTPPPTNSTCGNMAPVCTSNTLSFTALDAGTSASTTDPGNDYDCLATQPDPTWYYFEISTAGDIDFDITAGSDIDFALWGPYANLPTAQAACGSLPAPIDCSYTTSATETANITGAQVGEVYVLVVTNYAGVVQTVTMQQTGGTAATDCSIVTCAADVGTVTPAMGNGSSNNFVLCDNESMTITSDDNYVLPPSPDLRGLGYAIYACAPTTGDPSTDPCWTGYYFTGEDLTETNDVNNLYDFILANPDPGAGASGTPSGQTLFFAPITMDDIARIAGGGTDDNLGHDIDGDGCFDQGAAIEVNYLDPIAQNTSEDCGAGTVTITLSGGYPAFEPTASYTVTATGTGTLTQSGAQGQTLSFASVAPGGTINITVTDDSNGCTFTYSYNSTCPVATPCNADAGTW